MSLFFRWLYFLLLYLINIYWQLQPIISEEKKYQNFQLLQWSCAFWKSNKWHYHICMVVRMKWHFMKWNLIETIFWITEILRILSVKCTYLWNLTLLLPDPTRRPDRNWCIFWGAPVHWTLPSSSHAVLNCVGASTHSVVNWMGCCCDRWPVGWMAGKCSAAITNVWASVCVKKYIV